MPAASIVRVARRASALAVALVLAGVPAASSAQATWVVRSQPQADLWYAALAQLPFEGFGELPLYDADYAARLRDAKRTAGVETRLDREASRFRIQFSRDSAFEVLHFVPIYFVGTDRDGMFAALRAVAAGRDPATVRDPRARFGAAMLTAVLPKPEQRATLGAFTEALDDEWQRFYGGWWSSAADGVGRRADSVQVLWDVAIGPALRSFLVTHALDAGLILVSPALGPEGRVFTARPENRTDNVIAVRLPAGRGAGVAATVSVAREACYPVASEIVSQQGGTDRLADERASSRLAVRCGAILLESAPHGLREAYERAFAGDRSFTSTFAVPSSLLSTLRARLDLR